MTDAEKQRIEKLDDEDVTKFVGKHGVKVGRNVVGYQEDHGAAYQLAHGQLADALEQLRHVDSIREKALDKLRRASAAYAAAFPTEKQRRADEATKDMAGLATSGRTFAGQLAEHGLGGVLFDTEGEPQ